MKEWHDLFEATCGSAAALTGLIFVSVSLNLSKILSIPNLPNRALVSLIFLINIMIISIIFLVPTNRLNIIGLLVLLTAMITWTGMTALEIQMYKNTDPKYKRLFFIHLFANQLALAPYLVAGIVMLNFDKRGIFWIIPGLTISFIKAIWDAWVLLIEINR